MPNSLHTSEKGTAINPAVADATRSGEPDRYLAALLAPTEQREALLALAALSAELSTIPARVVREPAMGDIRLQWWRDALAMPPEIKTAHPVADAVREAISRQGLPTDLLEDLIDSRSALIRQPVSLSQDEQRDMLWKTEGLLFALGARIVGLPDSPEVDATCVAAGEAYGLTRLLLGLPRSLAQGRVLLAKPQLDSADLDAEALLAGVTNANVGLLLQVCSAQIRGNLDAARGFVTNLPRRVRVPFLPLALVAPYLRALERLGQALLRQEAYVAPFTRVRRIAAAHLLGRL